MNLLGWLFDGLYTQLDRMEVKMDQERLALDALTAALNAHCTVVDAAIQKIKDLIAAQVDPDVDNSAEIAALAGQIQAATDTLKASV